MQDTRRSFTQTQKKRAVNSDFIEIDLVVKLNYCSKKEDSNSETASSKSAKECSLNSETQDVHAIKYKMSKAKERCMAYFRSLHSHLQVLSKDDLKGTRIEHGFKRAFMSLFGQDVDTFTRTMLLNVDQLQKQLDKDEFQEDESMTAFWVVQHFRDTLLQHLGNVKKSVAERTRHQRQTDSIVQDDSSRSGNDTDADDADIRPIYNEEPMAETTEQTTLLLANNAELKAQIQEKFLQCFFKNDLGIVRQPNVFKSEKAQMSKQRFASQVDVNNNLSKPVTQHYFPKKTKFAFAKPDHVIASSSSWNSSKNMPRFSSNDMVYNHYLDEARKKAQERDRGSSKPSVMPFLLRFQSSADGRKPKPRATIKHLGVSLSKRKLFDSCTSKVDSEPPHGSNVDIPNIHECKQTLDVSAGTSINVQKEQSLDLSAEVQQAAKTVTTSNELEFVILLCSTKDSMDKNQVVLKSSAVTTTDASNKRQQPDSTSSTSTLATSVTANGNFDFFWDNNDDVDIEEEEHLAPTNSTAVALPAVDHAPSAEETEPFETDKLLVIPTPPPSPLSPWSSPLPQIPSPPLPLILLPLPISSPPPASPTYPLGY
ncbi:hypothetical protein Tco_0719204 [Tanacetum coccineum]